MTEVKRIPTKLISTHANLTLCEINGKKISVIPDKVKEIEDECFKNIEVDEVRISKSVQKIGKNAFSGCKRIKSVLLAKDS